MGSFEKDCTTLYVGGLGNRKALEEDLWEEFGEWGEIEVQYVHYYQPALRHFIKEIKKLSSKHDSSYILKHG